MSAADDVGVATRIQVVIRVRPVLPHESSEPIAVTCSPDGGKVQVELPDKETSKPALSTSSRPDAKLYPFDACLTGSTTQAQLFDICGMDELVEAAVDGYSVTIFAFGQTGSGKTHSIIGPSIAGFQEPAWSTAGCGRDTPYPLPDPITMGSAAGAACAGENGLQQHLQGNLSNSSSDGDTCAAPSGQDDGVLSRCLATLYSCTDARRKETSCRVTVSCCEIYNEVVTDLLAKNKNQQLQVRQDSLEGFYVEGLTQKAVQSCDRALHLMSDALMYRHTRAHRLNSFSSRSHCLITLTVASQESGSQEGASGGVKRVGKLTLVDLAGSERLKDTGNSAKEVVRETGAINKSLFTLGQVLAALSVRSGCGITGHVPFRDSKLTQLLWNGLKGGGRALMLACLSPLKAHAEESLNTLHFASMALRIKVQPIVIMDPQDQMVLEMRDTIKALQDDCRSLAAAITQMSTGADVTKVLQTLPPTLVQDALRYGSSSAPSADLARRHSPARRIGSMRASKQGSKRSSIGSQYLTSKPKTADPSLRHSFPSMSHSASSSRTSGNDQGSIRARERQPAMPWNSSTALGTTGVMLRGEAYMPGQLGHSATGAVQRSSWSASVTVPRSGRSSPQRSSIGISNGMLMHKGGGATVDCSLLQFPGSIGKAPWTGVSSYADLAAREAAAAAVVAAATVVNTGGSSFAPGALQPQSAVALEAFPELAALEQQFQQHQLAATQLPGTCAATGEAACRNPENMERCKEDDVLPAASGDPLNSCGPSRPNFVNSVSIGHSPDTSPVAVALAAATQQTRLLVAASEPQVHRVSFGETNKSDPGSAQEQQKQEALQQPPLLPEPKALGWAERNIWFGADTEMTQLAYKVHDRLIGQGVDPASDAYYAAIESEISQQLPGKWAQWQALMTTATATAGRSIAGSRSIQQPPRSTTYTSYRVSLKSPVPKLSSSGGVSPSKPAGAVVGPTSISARQQQQQQQQPPWVPCKVAGVVKDGGQVLYGHALANADSLIAQHSRSPTRHRRSHVHTSSSSTSAALDAYPVCSTQSAKLGLLQIQPCGQSSLPGDAFAQQMLQLYQQQGGTQATEPQQAQSSQQQAQDMHQQAQALSGSVADMQQHQGGESTSVPSSPTHSLPELRTASSPVPTITSGAGGAAAIGTLIGNSSTAGSVQRYASRLGGMATVANQVLASSPASYYDGAGPLTGGAKHSWSMSKAAGDVNIGRDLAEVLRSGVMPGNKSLSELQADYRAARALVLDQLRRQKEETERQRQRILLQIGRAINSSKWQS